MTTDRSHPRMSTISPPLGLAGAAPWAGRPRKGGLSPRSEGAVNSTSGEGRSSGLLGAESMWGCGPDEILFLPPACCGAVKCSADHGSSARDLETSNADYDALYRTITSYPSRRLSNRIGDHHRGVTKLSGRNSNNTSTRVTTSL